MKSEMSRKGREKPDPVSKEYLSLYRAKMEKSIVDKLLNGESLISEGILMESEAFDSLINEYMKKEL
ncbi:MAG TPA: hypothetical protein VF941_07935 [Clostridia bacterium]